MNQTSIGTALKETYKFLSEIYSDTSKLLSIVEDYMKSKNFLSLWGSAAFWDRSQAYYGNFGWLCHYLSRIYVPKNPNDKKPYLKDDRFMFINIYLVPKQVEQPIIIYGVAKISQEEIFKSWKDVMCDNYGPDFVTTDTLDSWESTKFVGESALKELTYKISPLVEVNDQIKTKVVCDDVINKYYEMGQ